MSKLDQAKIFLSKTNSANSNCY